jgi:UDP-N-acetylmuramoylalanine--D-glutamate ligase
VTTEICLFWQRCENLLIGVTGTKGKSTTASMIAHILRSQRPCFLGGNIGGSLLEKLDEINRSGAPVVLELSSFMLHWLGQIQSSPAVAVVTMLSTDHLDWHGSPANYIDAKRNITRFQLPGETLVRRGDPVSRTFVAPAGVRLREYPDASVKPFDLIVPGAHNATNAQAAFLAVEAPGVLTWDHAQAALRTFIGLEHRLQLVHDAGGVRFFNDSIATIPDAAVIACDSFEKGRVIQIVGGAVKEGLSWDAMCDHLAARCKKVLTIGTNGPALAKRCGAAGEYVATLETAVLRAKELAQPGDVVLLSPGTASYDQYANYEKRGEAFANFARSS